MMTPSYDGTTHPVVVHRKIVVQTQLQQEVADMPRPLHHFSSMFQSQSYLRSPLSLLLVCLLLLSSLATSTAAVAARGPSTHVPSPSVSLHHMSLYSTPSQPPTSLSFLLFTLPFSTPLRFKVARDEPSSAPDSTGIDDGPSYQLLGLHEIETRDIGVDFASLSCGAGNVADMTLHFNPLELDHDLPTNASSSYEPHLSSFEHWLISNNHAATAAHAASNGKRAKRQHVEQTFLLPQVRGHRDLGISKFVRSMSQVRKTLAQYPGTLLVVSVVEAHLPYYPEMKYVDSSKFVIPAESKAKHAEWSCQWSFKPEQQQTSWPFTRVYATQKSKAGQKNVNSNRRLTALNGPYQFAAPHAASIPKQGVWIETPVIPASTIVARELKPTAAEMAALENARRQNTQLMEEDAAAEAAQAEGVISLLDIDAVLGVQGGSVKAVIAPVMLILQDAIADEGEHTTDQETGSRVDTTTPSQVLELVMTPLKDQIYNEVSDNVSNNIMASLKESMTEFLSTYIHDEVVHDATPPLYLAVVEIIEKHVKDNILKLVPPAVRKHVPITLHNRLSRSLMHSIPPALTQILKIAHSPTLHYFCYRCFYREAPQYSLFKKVSPGSPESGYAKKHYCELCHSSAERLYYHNYHAAYYSDYYSDYFVPYFTQSLVEMEKTRDGKDNAYNRPAKDDEAGGGDGGDGGDE